jgi:flagella basal body P-ring formation protein FlgA
MMLQDRSGSFFHLCFLTILVFFVLALLPTPPCSAYERLLPVPTVTIYPGDVIRDSMIDERPIQYDAAPEGAVVSSKNMLIGRVAKRTLLPGKPIAPIAVDSPRLVLIGSQVKIVFEEEGLVIVAYGAALQAGAVGDMIRVRNQESGLIVTGRVQADGSIRVGEG